MILIIRNIKALVKTINVCIHYVTTCVFILNAYIFLLFLRLCENAYFQCVVFRIPTHSPIFNYLKVVIYFRYNSLTF